MYYYYIHIYIYISKAPLLFLGYCLGLGFRSVVCFEVSGCGRPLLLEMPRNAWYGWGLGFRVWGLGFGVWGLGLGFRASGFRGGGAVGGRS